VSRDPGACPGRNHVLDVIRSSMHRTVFRSKNIGRRQTTTAQASFPMSSSDHLSFRMFPSLDCISFEIIYSQSRFGEKGAQSRKVEGSNSENEGVTEQKGVAFSFMREARIANVKTGR
jgi:hypothetical protein